MANEIEIINMMRIFGTFYNKVYLKEWYNFTQVLWQNVHVPCSLVWFNLNNAILSKEVITKPWTMLVIYFYSKTTSCLVLFHGRDCGVSCHVIRWFQDIGGGWEGDRISPPRKTQINDVA
jgi:hypothetical protein